MTLTHPLAEEINRRFTGGIPNSPWIIEAHRREDAELLRRAVDELNDLHNKYHEYERLFSEKMEEIVANAQTELEKQVSINQALLGQAFLVRNAAKSFVTQCDKLDKLAKEHKEETE